MKICTPKQMQEIDRRAIEEKGIPGQTLMENAGRAVFEAILRRFGSVQSKTVAVVCGKGNNGGDGFVVARYLKENGANVEINLLGRAEEIKGDAAENMMKAGKCRIAIKEISDASQYQIRTDTWLIVDAIFGTGFQGEIRPPYAQIIAKINDSEVPVVAVDCPSGLNGATGELSDPTVRAALTVTFGFPKIGQVLFPGKAVCGILEVADIGFPPGIAEDIKTNLVRRLEAIRLLPKRRPDAHKGDYGKLYVLAGSTGYTGAAVLTAMTALRCGTGLVYLGVPESLNPIIEIKSTEVISKPLPDVKKSGRLALRGMGEIRRHIADADAAAIGPGIGTHHETAELIRRIVSEMEKPAVLDADALNIMAQTPEILKKHRGPLVISPHPGEFARLTGKSIAEIAADRFDLATKFAGEYNLVLVLKGAPTITALPSGDIHINYSGNDGMATAGSGDVLTGLIGGFLAQGMTAETAAILANYVHGLAGDIAAADIGGRGLIASDIMAMVPQSLVELEGAAEHDIPAGNETVR